MYSVNMNQRMEQYSNRRIMCTQMKDFVIVKQPQEKKKFLTHFLLLLTCCVCFQYKHVCCFTYFQLSCFDVTIAIHTKQEKRCFSHLKDLTLLLLLIPHIQSLLSTMQRKNKIEKWQYMAGSRVVRPALLASSMERIAAKGGRRQSVKIPAKGQEQICSDKCTCCHTEMEVEYQFSIPSSHCILTWSQAAPELTL